MSKVQILAPEIISKIAAGEVIERPASVIKELMENSIDAQAQAIEIDIKDAGKALIHIKDSGNGIEHADLEKIFFRHATSKIKSIDDLDRIQSLGFRGEALYSIGAISDCLLRSKTQEQDSGWELHIRGGKKINLRPVSMNNGTELEIKELFFNTPARKKFLKTNSTELNQILNVFIPYTLLYPKIRFRLTHQDKTLVDLSPLEDLRNRIAQSLNLEEKHLLDISQDFPQDQISIRMILGDINIQRARKDLQYIFVNDRPVQNRSISFHLNQIYRLLFPTDIAPFFSIYIHLPPEDIDANIHPTKREIKIRDEQHLCSLIRVMCEKTLMKQGKPKQVELPDGPEIETSFSSEASPQPAHSTDRSSFKQRSASSPSGKTFVKEFPSDSQSANAIPVPEPFQESPFASQHYAFQNQELLESTIAENLYTPNSTSPNSLTAKLANARYVGSFLKKYLFLESGASLLVIDQHAAQERIMFEKFKNQLDAGKIEVQHLLSPILLKLTPQELLNWEESKPKLDEIGLESTLWDKETVAVHSYPNLLKNPETAARALLEGETIRHCDHATIARRACRASIMAGDAMDLSQVEYQRQQLLNCQDPFTCPHGRPTVIEMSENFLNKQFLRT